MSASRYLHLIEFPIALGIQNQALGLRCSIALGNVNGSLYLPRPNLPAVGSDLSFRRLNPPAVRNIAFAARMHDHSEQPAENFSWGGYSSWNPKDLANSAVAFVEFAALAFPAKQKGRWATFDDITSQFGQHFDACCSRLVDWIEVQTHADLDSTQPFERVSVGPKWSTAAWTYRDAGKNEHEYPNYTINVMGASLQERALDKRQWSNAVRGANRSLRPPEIHLLLRDARAAQLRSSGRRAVLDAATAVDLIVGPALRSMLLKRNAPAFVERLLKQEWQFKRRMELMHSLGMFVPPGLSVDVMELRNKVIHGNKPVSHAQAHKAVEIAQALAEHYTPLGVP